MFALAPLRVSAESGRIRLEVYEVVAAFRFLIELFLPWH